MKDFQMYQHDVGRIERNSFKDNVVIFFELIMYATPDKLILEGLVQIND